MNTAIIVAAGSGTRFDNKTPKQFLDLLGKPVIVHTLLRFQNASSIDEIVVVASSKFVKQTRELCSEAGITKLKRVVKGGKTRAESVRNGFAAVDRTCEIVCVHDGVRPLVSPGEIDRTVACAEQFAAACLTAPVVDTIKTVDYGKITGTVDRAVLRRALTPQAFRYAVLATALESADLGESTTDECLLVERTGVMITTVEGSTRNIKITTTDDLKLAETFLQDPKTR